jgi:hypothetical protein
MMHDNRNTISLEDEEFINLSINLSSSGTNRLSVNLFSTHPEDTAWPALVEQFIKALNAYGFIIKGTNQFRIDSYGSVTRTKINEGHTDE